MKNVQLTGEPMQCSDATADELKALRAERIDALLEHHTLRGVIPPKNDALLAQWRGVLERDFATGKELLDGLQPVMKPGYSIQAGGGARRPSCEIAREDLSSVSQAYLSAASPMEKGLVYRKEIDPILAKGDRFPFEQLKLQPITIDGQHISAVNALGTLVGNIISQRTLALIVSRRPMLLQVVTDFSPEQARLNQTVYTRAIALPTVQNFGAAPTDTADTDYPVALNQHKEARFQYLASEYNATGRNLVKEHSDALSLAIGNYMVDEVAKLITAAFTLTAQVGAANTKDYASITGACKALNVGGVPDMDRFGWVNSDVAESLRNDELVMAMFSHGGGAYAQWNKIEGFEQITEFPALPANVINLIGFFFHKNALLVASRVHADVQAMIGAGYPGRLQTVTDPVTGLSVVSNQWIVQDTLAINDRLILLFGCARGNPAVGQTWKSA